MKIGILGSGRVAQTLGGKLLEQGHEVIVSSRDVNRSKEGIPSGKEFAEMMKKKSLKARCGNFGEAVEFGDLIINATVGLASLDVVRSIGKGPFKGKILIDVANPLDFSKGFPPSVSFCNEESLGERIQKELPDTKVVKALNMVNAEIMVDPSKVKSQGDIFIAGNDKEAKDWVAENFLRRDFGWKTVTDLGGIQSARGMEIYLILWLTMMNALGTPHFNIKVVR